MQELNFTTQLWVPVLIRVGSTATRRTELLHSCTGWPYAPCNSSVLILPPSAVTQTRICIHTDMAISSLVQNLVLYYVGKKGYNSTIPFSFSAAVAVHLNSV